MTHGAELFGLLRGLGLPVKDHAVFGSGPLLAHGIIDSVDDLDVLCRGDAWALVSDRGEMVEVDGGVSIVSLFDGALTFGRTWAYGDFDVDELIDSAELIDGVPFVRMEHVTAFKRSAGRPKDLAHLRAIEEWTSSRST